MTVGEQSYCISGGHHCSVALSSPGRADAEFTLTTLWNAQDMFAVLAKDNSLWVGVDSGYSVAHWAFDVHEEGVGRLDLSLEFMLGGLESLVNVKKIDFHVCSQKRKC